MIKLLVAIKKHHHYIIIFFTWGVLFPAALFSIVRGVILLESLPEQATNHFNNLHISPGRFEIALKLYYQGHVYLFLRDKLVCLALVFGYGLLDIFYTPKNEYTPNKSRYLKSLAVGLMSIGFIRALIGLYTFIYWVTTSQLVTAHHFHMDLFFTLVVVFIGLVAYKYIDYSQKQTVNSLDSSTDASLETDFSIQSFRLKHSDFISWCSKLMINFIFIHLWIMIASIALMQGRDILLLWSSLPSTLSFETYQSVVENSIFIRYDWLRGMFELTPKSNYSGFISIMGLRVSMVKLFIPLILSLGLTIFIGIKNSFNKYELLSLRLIGLFLIGLGVVYSIGSLRIFQLVDLPIASNELVRVYQLETGIVTGIYILLGLVSFYFVTRFKRATRLEDEVASII